MTPGVRKHGDSSETPPTQVIGRWSTREIAARSLQSLSQGNYPHDR